MIPYFMDYWFFIRRASAIGVYFAVGVDSSLYSYIEGDFESLYCDFFLVALFFSGACPLLSSALMEVWAVMCLDFEFKSEVR